MDRFAAMACLDAVAVSVLFRQVEAVRCRSWCADVPAGRSCETPFVVSLSNHEFASAAMATCAKRALTTRGEMFTDSA